MGFNLNRALAFLQERSQLLGSITATAICEERISMWAIVPEEILEMILALLSLVDLACVASVCRPWHQITRQFALDRRLTIRHLPWVIISTCPDFHINALLSPSSNPISEQRRHCCGTHGTEWLAVWDECYGLYLLHPLLRHRIALPPPSTLLLNYPRSRFFSDIFFISHHFVHKIILSSEPTSSTCIVVILYGKDQLAYCRLGEPTWTGFEPGNGTGRHYEDAVFFKDYLVVVDSSNCVWAIFLRPDRTERKLLMQPKLDHANAAYNARYLMVNPNGRLIMVARYRSLVCPNHSPQWLKKFETTGFQVFELDPDRARWLEVRSLGNQLMFLGWSLSAIVPAEEIKGDFGVDAIYFTECGKAMECWSTSPVPRDTGKFVFSERRVVHMDVTCSGSFNNNGNVDRSALFFYMFYYCNRM